MNKPASFLKDTDPLLTPEEVSEFLRIPKSTVYKLCGEGQIPAARIGKHWRFDREKVFEWLEGQFESESENGPDSES